MSLQCRLINSMAVFCLAAAVHAAADDPTVDFFSATAPIRTLTIQISQTNQIELFKDPRANVPVEIREGNRLYTNVALHLKGNERGSFRSLGEKPAMTVNFDKFQKGQLFHGLDKIYLNNSVEDESYSCEMLGSDLFNAAGLPAPRISYARVVLNGRDCGLYVVKEGFNKRFLRRHFRDADGNFYDGGFITDIDENLERSSGRGSSGNADLKELAAAAREPDASQRWQRLQKVLDVDRFISFMAMEVMSGHWDGYTMNRNNYRVYHDPMTHKMVFLPHGMDIMFSEPESSLEPDMEGLVSRALITTREGRRRYRARARELATTVFNLPALTNRLHQLYAKLHPVLQSISPQVGSNHTAEVQELHEAVVQRATTLTQAVQFTPPPPLLFDAHGIATFSEWHPQDESEVATLDRFDGQGTNGTLYIAPEPPEGTKASWRAKAMVAPGKYQFSARVRTEGLVPRSSPLGEGAGIRVDMFSRREGPAGTVPWTTLTVDLVVEHEPDEIEFICEVSAKDGKAWFVLDSLKVMRLK